MTERLLRFIGKRGANEVHISMEILSTLHEVVKGTKNLNLAKLPQTFWVCITAEKSERVFLMRLISYI